MTSQRLIRTVPRALAALAAAAMVVLSLPAAAVALGPIVVDSGLNDRLAARVPLRGLEPGEFEEITVELAPQDAFERAGLARTYLLTRLRFTAVPDGERAGTIRITSTDYLREPALSFIVQVTGKGGRVVQRRYDVLLGPR